MKNNDLAEARSLFDDLALWFYHDPKNIVSSILIELAILSNGDPAIALSGKWPESRGPELPPNRFEEWDIFVDSSISIVRKTEYLQRIKSVEESILLYPDRRGDRPKEVNTVDAALVNACEEFANVDKIISLIGDGANVNGANATGMTPLLVASVNGHVEVVKVLLENGANINAPSNYDAEPYWAATQTPLSLACFKNHVEVVSLLLASEANVNVIEKFGSSPLKLASTEGNVEVVKLLLTAGANVDAVDMFGTSSLMSASIKGNIEVVKSLLAAGANTRPGVKDGNTPISRALKRQGYSGDVDDTPLNRASINGHGEVVKVLVAAGASEPGMSALMLTICSGDAERVKDMIATKVDVNAPDDRGNTPLMMAVVVDDAHCVYALIAAGADVNAKDNNGRTAAIHAAIHCRTDCLQVLISAGADVNTKDQDGKTALMAAINLKGKGLKCVEALITAGVDVNVKDNNGHTALRTTVIYGLMDHLRMLIDAGADVNAKTKEGQTALDWASKPEFAAAWKAAGVR